MYRFRKTNVNPETEGEKEHLLDSAILPKKALRNNYQIGKGNRENELTPVV